MWCIRSISPDELHPDDVRGRFIRYCQNPARIDDATSQAEDRFDSDFERDVYRHLIARGYRVKVQHRVGRFRIDLVVEGRRGRLAVELDGDAYHGPDRWEADRNRQAILERLGWTFHRIRGSAYYRDPDAALTSLWDRLEALGIRPAERARHPRHLRPSSSTAPSRKRPHLPTTSRPVPVNARTIPTSHATVPDISSRRRQLPASLPPSSVNRHLRRMTA